jgi:N-acetylmuramoyl-L-alanine amidase
MAACTSRILVSLVLAACLATPAEARTRSARPRSRPAAVSKGADAAFGEAKRAYSSLKKDEKRRKFRDQWMIVVQKYLAVAERYPASPRAARALFEAAELLSELSRVSLARRDLREAIAAYQKLCQKYPRSPLAGEAHLALGKIHLDRQGDNARAERELRAAAASPGEARKKALSELAVLGPVRRATGAEREERRTESKRSEEKRVEERRSEERRAEEDEKAAAHLTLATRDDEEETDEPPTPEVSIPLSKGEIDPRQLRAIQEATKAPVSLSVQAGLKVRRIVIDPGHGGRDSGAVGPGGVREKEVTLAIARRLRDRLEAEGFEALLTRDSDRFVALEDRARFANRKKGDLFVSIHCNAYKSRRMRGTETYTLNVASDAYAIRLAARENAASERTLSDLQLILADLATRANTEDSIHLARLVQAKLVEAQTPLRQGTRDLGVKQALFYVLLGAHMPSVLVETAFLTNPQEEERLADPASQQVLADAIASGISRFTSRREALARALID